MSFSWNIFPVHGASQHGASQGVREPCKITTEITDSTGPAGPCVTGHIENRAIAMLGIAPAFGAAQGYMPLLCTYAYVRYLALSAGVCAVSHRTYPSGLAAPAMPPHRNRFTGKSGKTRCACVYLRPGAGALRCIHRPGASPPYPRHSHTSRRVPGTVPVRS